MIRILKMTPAEREREIVRTREAIRKLRVNLPPDIGSRLAQALDDLLVAITPREDLP